MQRHWGEKNLTCRVAGDEEGREDDVREDLRPRGRTLHFPRLQSEETGGVTTWSGSLGCGKTDSRMDG